MSGTVTVLYVGGGQIICPCLPTLLYALQCAPPCTRGVQLTLAMTGVLSMIIKQRPGYSISMLHTPKYFEIANVVEVLIEICCNSLNIVEIYMKQCPSVNVILHVTVPGLHVDLQDTRWRVLVGQYSLVHSPRVLLGDVDRVNTVIEQQWMAGAQGRSRGPPPLHMVVAVIAWDRLGPRLPSIPTQSLINEVRIARELLRRGGHALDTGDYPHEHYRDRLAELSGETHRHPSDLLQLLFCSSCTQVCHMISKSMNQNHVRVQFFNGPDLGHQGV